MWLASEWVVGAELQWAKHRPDDLLDVICLLLSRNLSEWELELLGSGPIETLLSLNYDDMVNRVMEIARQNKDAQTALLFVDPPPDKESHFDQLLIGVRM